MSGGVRPKGSKSYAATRSPEVAEAFRQDQAAQKTLDAVEKKVCPECGSEKYHLTDSIADSDRRRPTRDCYYCYECGYEEKVD